MIRKTFESSGEHYAITASIQEYKNEPDKDNDTRKYLDSEKIGLFTYKNTLNNLIPTATIEYLDTQGIIAKFQDVQNSIMSIGLQHFTIKTEGKATTETEVPGENIDFTLYVSEIIPKKQDSNDILYEIHLVGLEFSKLYEIVKFSNNDKDKKDSKDGAKGKAGAIG